MLNNKVSDKLLWLRFLVEYDYECDDDHMMYCTGDCPCKTVLDQLDKETLEEWELFKFNNVSFN